MIKQCENALGYHPANNLGGDLKWRHCVSALLAVDAAWGKSQRDGDGVHATGDGYQLIAAKIADWPAWRDWFMD